MDATDLEMIKLFQGLVVTSPLTVFLIWFVVDSRKRMDRIDQERLASQKEFNVSLINEMKDVSETMQDIRDTFQQMRTEFTYNKQQKA